eukprot:7090336-Prymnesium_polylepis.1
MCAHAVHCAVCTHVRSRLASRRSVPCSRQMDFEAPRAVIDAVVERAKHGIYGYTDPPPELVESTIGRLSTLYGSPEPADASWFRWLPGLISGLHHAVRATCSASSNAAPRLDHASAVGIRSHIG